MPALDLEPQGTEMQPRPNAGPGEIHRSRLRLGCSNEFGRCLEPPNGGNHQNARGNAERHNPRKIPHWIVAQLRIQGWRYGMCG
jgi:hypothetical protein